jgi:bis(5'-nucleosidyl)-tetraphosphatase
MHKVKSCGVIVFRHEPLPSFLLMRHASRFDLPKGHARRGETDLECALRELEEETGIVKDDIRLDPAFRCEQIYYPRYQRYGGAVVEKTLVVFLAHLLRDREIRVTEHIGFEWVPWRPPHQVQIQGIDPLLSKVEDYFARAGVPWPSTTTT